jgi:16S rRNA (guanine966-N2)-methyltransferase
MRIITGTAKGRLLHAPKGRKITRPALAKVREAIFSSLGDVTGLVVMDVFAGTGSLGLEALSRGAERAYFIDSHPQAIKSLVVNLKALGFSEKARIFDRKLPFGLKRVKIEEPLDVIFCDPPYDKDLLNPTLRQLLDQGFVSQHTVIIVEHSGRERPQIEGLLAIKEKQYGQTYITYLKKVS